MSRQHHILPIIVLLLLLFSCNAFSQRGSSKPEPDSMQVTFQKCFTFIKERRWDSAIYYAEIYKILIKEKFGEISEMYAQVLYLLGEIRRGRENMLAYQFFKQSYEVFAKIDFHKNRGIEGVYAELVCRLGLVCDAIGATSEAEFYLKKGIELTKSMQVDGYFQMNICLAEIYTSKANYIKVDSIYTAMRNILDTMPADSLVHYRMASIYNNIGILDFQTGNPQKALSYLKKAAAMESIAKKEGYPDNDYVQVTLNLAEAFTLNNQTDSARIKCLEAEDNMLIKMGPLYASLLKEKAFICQHENKLQEAIDLYTQYKKIMDSWHLKAGDYQGSMVNLAILYIDTKQFKKADSLLRWQITQLRQSGLQYSYIMQQSVASLCAGLIDMKQYNEATDSLIALCHLTFTAMDKNFTGMSEAGKLQYENDINKSFDLLYISVYNNKTISKHILSEIYQLELKRKGLILNTQLTILNNARNSYDTAFLNIYNEWLNNRQILTKQYSLPYNERFLVVDSLENINEMLEKKVSAKGLVTNTMGNTQTVHFKADTRQPSSADIEFVRFDYKAGKTVADSAFYIAFILRSLDTIPALVHLCSEKELLRIMKDEKGRWINENQLTQNIYSGRNTSGNKFYRLVWQPMEKYLKGIKTINYSTSGLLNNIAFQAVNDGKNYLVNRYDFRRFFNLGDIGNKNEVYETPEALSIWGNMNYDKASGDTQYVSNTSISNNTFSILPAGLTTTAATESISKEPLQPFNTNEPLQLKKIFGSSHIKITSYENTDASEENFKYYASGTKGILHISTHGFYTPLDKEKTKALLPGNFISGIENPLFRCGLAFSGVNYYWLNGISRNNRDDGILTGYEVAQLDLHNVQLVTLSACETGLGDITDNEANIGLQRAFKLAGVHNLLVSLWEVPAKQTAELLSLFYTNWLKGQTLSTSLQNAERVMSKEYPPYFWAGFVLIE
jgi:CHAT domain-containing protein